MVSIVAVFTFIYDEKDSECNFCKIKEQIVKLKCKDLFCEQCIQSALAAQQREQGDDDPQIQILLNQGQDVSQKFKFSCPTCHAEVPAKKFQKPYEPRKEKNKKNSENWEEEF